jgi:GT2 family glycosyltransferase
MTRSSAGYPLIDVAIVTARGSWPLVEDCLRSLRDCTPRAGTLAVHVVDNASRDGTAEAIRAWFPEVEVEELGRNLGFATACNRVIARSGAPYVLLLNPDTVVHAGALDRLVESLERHPRAAVAGPRLLGPDGRPDHNAKRAFPSVAAAAVHLFRVRPEQSAGYARDDIPDDGAGVVDSVSGSCMLVRREAIAEVGLLDEGYWMYGEDLDWCRRFGQRSWEVRYEGSATILHVKHGVTGRHRSLRTNWAFHRSMGRFYRRFEAGPRPILDLAVYTGILVRFVVAALRSAVARRFAE